MSRRGIQYFVSPQIKLIYLCSCPGANLSRSTKYLPERKTTKKTTINMSKLEAAQLFSVKGLVAVVTGAGSGLGSMMAHALDVNGAAKVFILGRRESKLKEVAAKAVRNHLGARPKISFLLLEQAI